MTDKTTISEIKKAVREVVDETMVNYAHGAGAFTSSLVTSIAGAADAFDRFFTENLERDRPHIAAILLEARLHSARQWSKIVNKKIEEFEMRIAKLKRGPRRKGGRRQSRRNG